jgi:CBS domain-containing protein
MSVEPPSGRGIAVTIGDIDAATDESVLRAGIDRAHEAIRVELAAHTPALTLAAAWSEVLRHSVAAGARLVAGAGETRWTWFVSGSVARGEAAPGSDVETMIALDNTIVDAEKAELMARAAEVHALLERCGVRGDANGVLASRPRFCRRLGSWSDGIERWSADPREDRGVVMTGLMADSTGVLTQPGVAVNALRAQTVAAKLAAIDPVVKIARWAALSAGSDALPTLDRRDAAAAAKILDADDVSSLRECFGWLVRFRWRTRAGTWLRGGRVSDVVSLSETAPQERAVLRSVAREVAGISRKLTYLASTSTFR